ncbi:MAG: heavy metal translocating P-type ATPase [Planctomycetes bacterium]|nr:heavy metal translocating P-type ATPase [Planctomycetota bacterium]
MSVKEEHAANPAGPPATSAGAEASLPPRSGHAEAAEGSPACADKSPGHQAVAGACCGARDLSPKLRGVLTGSCLLLGIAGYLASSLYGREDFANALFAGAYLTGGWAPTLEVCRAFARRKLDVNFLMILAAIGAIFIGHMGEGTVLLFLFSLSGTLERYTLERTARSIEALVELHPDTVTVVRNGEEIVVPMDSVVAGEMVRIKPAERLGVDGVIESGRSTIDESTITGESIPVEKGPGEDVFAGTLNYKGTLLVKATRTAGETMLAKIVRTVREARSGKTQAERFVERWEKPYVVGVLVASASAGLFAYLYGKPLDEAFYRSMTLLVGASPCALVIATPAAVLAGLTRAARLGVLFKAGRYLEAFHDAKVIALDKTGTLTQGKPEVVEVFVAGGGEDGQAAQLRLLAAAASVEKHSEHALAHAVLTEAKKRGAKLAPVEDFHAHVGEGVHGNVGGTWVGVGRESLFRSHEHVFPESVADVGRRMREGGVTALLVYVEGGPAGVIGIADKLRPEAPAALARLRRMGITHIALLTGDHERVGQAVGDQAGVDEVKSRLRPDDKVAALRHLKEGNGPVVFVGDGVNDAPALAAADVGVAMGGGGTDAALETADVVLMRDDLRGLVHALWLGRRTRAAVRRALFIAFSVIAVLVVTSAMGILPLWLAVLCHEGSTVLAIFSGLVLLVERAPVIAGD